MAKIKIRLVRSTIGALPRQRATVRSLGLRKIDSVVIQEDNPAIMGMIRTVAHLVEYKKIETTDEVK